MEPNQVAAEAAWTRADFSRVPYDVFTSQAIYRRENERVFRGPVWNYLCHEIEIAQPGDFLTTWIGETHVIAARSLRPPFAVTPNI